MHLDLPDYTRLLLGTYNKKLATNEISPSLAQSTPAKIRRECAIVYQERYEKKDDPVLRDFFGPAEHGRKFLAVIQEFDVDRFRPLDNYLKSGGKRAVSDRNLKLLAWLIDFRHRPHAFGKDYQLTGEEELLLKDDRQTTPGPDTIEIIPPGGGHDPAPPLEEEPEKPFSENHEPDGRPAPGKKKKRWGVVLLILMICTGGTSVLWQQKKSRQEEMGNALATGKLITEERQLPVKPKKDSLVHEEKVKPVKQDSVVKKKTVPLTIFHESGTCRAVTKKGMPCKRKAQNKGYCWQHS